MLKLAEVFCWTCLIVLRRNYSVLLDLPEHFLRFLNVVMRTF